MPGRADAVAAEPGYGFERREEAGLEPARCKCGGLVCHPGLNIQNVCVRVSAFGADWVVGNAHVNRLGTVERADRREPAAAQCPRECTLRIAEDGDCGDMLTGLGR